MGVTKRKHECMPPVVRKLLYRLAIGLNWAKIITYFAYLLFVGLRLGLYEHFQSLYGTRTFISSFWGLRPDTPRGVQSQTPLQEDFRLYLSTYSKFMAMPLNTDYSVGQIKRGQAFQLITSKVEHHGK